MRSRVEAKNPRTRRFGNVLSMYFLKLVVGLQLRRRVYFWRCRRLAELRTVRVAGAERRGRGEGDSAQVCLAGAAGIIPKRGQYEHCAKEHESFFCYTRACRFIRHGLIVPRSEAKLYY